MALRFDQFKGKRVKGSAIDLKRDAVNSRLQAARGHQFHFVLSGKCDVIALFNAELFKFENLLLLFVAVICELHQIINHQFLIFVRINRQ